MDFFLRFEKLGAKPRISNVVSRMRRAAMSSLVWIALSAVVCASSAFGQEARSAQAPASEATHFGWADVLRVDPVYDGPAGEPQQECYEEQVLIQPAAQANPPDDGKRVGGTIIGAIIGGVIGSRFGKGDGRKAAAAAGAVAGGVVGNNVAANQAQNQTVSGPARYSTQRRCRQVEGAAGRHVVAYDVEYRYRGEVYTSRMNSDPGDRIRVRVSVTPAE